MSLSQYSTFHILVCRVSGLRAVIVPANISPDRSGYTCTVSRFVFNAASKVDWFMRICISELPRHAFSGIFYLKHPVETSIQEIYLYSVCCLMVLRFPGNFKFSSGVQPGHDLYWNTASGITLK
jgi:hypothetical protein